MEGQRGTLEDLTSFKAVLTQWHTLFGKELRFFVGVDIGATNTRFAIHHKNDDKSYLESLFIISFKAGSMRLIVNTLHSLAAVAAEIVSVNALGACLDAAGPISPDRRRVEVTNFGPELEDRLLQVEELPQNLFPSPATVLVNDLEATCHGIKSLNEEGHLQEFFKLLWGTEDSEQPGLGPKNYAVAAVGTGLGVALLISPSGSKSHLIVPTENGHTLVTSTSPSSKSFEEESSFVKFLSDKLYGSKFSAEYEDVVSGRGLEYAYEWVAQQPGHAGAAVLNAGDIAAKALEGSSPESASADRAINLHYRYLMRVLKQLCIGMLCGGIFLAGGNQIMNNPAMEKHLESLRAEFMDHPKSSWLTNTQLYTQVKPVNLNLHGALHAAHAVTTARSLCASS